MPLLLSHGIAAWECMVGQAARMEEFAWHEGRVAMPPASPAVGPEKSTVQERPWADEKALRAYYGAQGGSVPDWVESLWRRSPGFLEGYTRIRALALSDGRLPRKAKELIIVSCHAAHRFEKGTALHVAGARASGASEGEVAEALLVAVTAAGIPAWIAFYPLTGTGAG
jgi:alkylhydroperoxidase/carboxymuconolactone decarboxylase family protein YurZ